MDVNLPPCKLISGPTYPPSLSHLAVSVPTLVSTLKGPIPSQSTTESPQPTTSLPPDHFAIGAFIFTPPSPQSPPKILLLRRAAKEPSFPLLWEVPGGGAESPPVDATLLDAVTREVLEETGLHVVRILGAVTGPGGEGWQQFEGMRIDPVTGRRRLWRKYNFFVEVEGLGGVNGMEDKGELPVKLADEEHVEWAWVGREDLVGVEFTADQQRIWVGAAFEQLEQVFGAVGA